MGKGFLNNNKSKIHTDRYILENFTSRIKPYNDKIHLKQSENKIINKNSIFAINISGMVI